MSYPDQEGELLLISRWAAAVGRVFPVQIQPVEAVGLEEGHGMVSEVLTTLSSGHHLGEGSRCQVPAADSQQGLQVGVDLLQVVEPLVPGNISSARRL